MKNTALTVLVVDDSVVQANHAANLCQETGASVFSAHNGLEAIEALRRKTIDVALIDLEMPIMDGVELINQIASEKLTQHIIILSSKDESLISSVGTMAEAKGLTVLATVSKPITADQVVCCFDGIHEASFARINVKSQFRDDYEPSIDEISTGIVENQFFLHYQPKLTSKGLLFKGVEALARWNHPDRGQIPPDIFIAAAEKYELIGTLTTSIFEQALKQKKEWRNKGLNLNLALNLSPLSLRRSNFADLLVDFVESREVKTSEVTLEVTENILFCDLAKSLGILARLRLKGFNISIDDYGTGFSNAEQLSNIPATELKLDKSIINGISSRPKIRSIVENTLRLASDLNLKTVAEGVETEADFAVLLDLGVHELQGYYFSKPLSSELIVPWTQSELRHFRKNI